MFFEKKQFYTRPLLFIELTYLRLTRLDMSRNRIASLPIELKNMSSTLEILRLSDNPLMAPPAVVRNFNFVCEMLTYFAV